MASVTTTLNLRIPFQVAACRLAESGEEDEPHATLLLFPSPRTETRESREVPVTGSPTLESAQAASVLASVPDLRSLIGRMRNTTPTGSPDF